MFVLPDLPYPHDALEPVISTRTMQTHHGKHHARYVEVLNQILRDRGDSLDSLDSLEAVILAAEPGKLFNNAAQVWNHTFFWTAMTPDRAAPDGALKAAIDTAFGGLEGLKAALVEEGAGHFASGWVWLAAEGSRLRVLSTHDGENLLNRPDLTPLLVCDLWEHAYYLDYQQDRKQFLERWFDVLPNWALAAAQYAAAQGSGDPWRHPPPVPS